MVKKAGAGPLQSFPFHEQWSGLGVLGEFKELDRKGSDWPVGWIGTGKGIGLDGLHKSQGPGEKDLDWTLRRIRRKCEGNDNVGGRELHRGVADSVL